MTDPKPSPQTCGQPDDGRPPAGGLTRTERRICDGLLAGKTRSQICRELGISCSLYHYHLHGLRRYSRVRTTVEAVVAWVRERSDPKNLSGNCHSERSEESLPAQRALENSERRILG